MNTKMQLDTKTHMANGRYEISERELMRYRQHGMAMVSFAKMEPHPSGSGSIGLKPLVECIGNGGANPKVGKPVEAWMRRGPVPAIIISSGLQASDASKSMVKFDAAREVETLKFDYCAKVSDNRVRLEPIYR